MEQCVAWRVVRKQSENRSMCHNCRGLRLVMGAKVHGGTIQCTKYKPCIYTAKCIVTCRVVKPMSDRGVQTVV